jgi:hypothetical protein
MSATGLVKMVVNLHGILTVVVRCPLMDTGERRTVTTREVLD